MSGIKLGFGVLVLVVLTGVGYALAHSFARPSQPVFQPEANMAFQPEAQMLESATNPADSLKRPERAAASSTRATLPYAFKSSVCPQGEVTPHFDCLESYYQKLVDTYGVDVAFSDLKERYESDAFVVTECHPITHVIGREAVKFYPTVSKAYQHGDSFCWSGYYHGVLEGIVKNIGQKNLASKLDTICADIPGKEHYTFDYYNCVHGLGHGIMELGGDDVFQSLKTCDNLTGEWEKQSCYSGVFMENIIVETRDGSSPGLKADQPLYPCTAADAKYKFQCYLGQTSYVLQRNGGNFTATFGACADVEGGFRAVCDQSIGRDAANYANHDGPQTKATCSLASVAVDQTNCIVGAVKEFISYYHAITQANSYCNLYTGQDQTTCLETGKQYYTLF
jgi:hypothetical protein